MNTEIFHISNETPLRPSIAEACLRLIYNKHVLRNPGNPKKPSSKMEQAKAESSSNGKGTPDETAEEKLVTEQNVKIHEILG